MTFTVTRTATGAAFIGSFRVADSATIVRLRRLTAPRKSWIARILSW